MSKVKTNWLEAMGEDELNDFIRKAKKIIGEPLSYAKLCDALEIKKKSSNSKVAQLNDLKLICDYKIQNNPTRYIIIEVYDFLLPCMDYMRSETMKIQICFETNLFKSFKDNEEQPLFLSNLELLQAAGMINKNFPYILDVFNMTKVGTEYLYMHYMGVPIYRFLLAWAKRKVRVMNVRGTFSKGDGFRLYTKHKNRFGFYIRKHNVPFGSELHRECLDIYQQTVKRHLPADWFGEWVHQDTWLKFKKELDNAVLERFKNRGNYVGMKRVDIYVPSSNDKIKNSFEYNLKNFDTVGEIKKKVKSKILNDRHMHLTYEKDGDKLIDTEYSVMQYDNFIDCNISSNPSIDFKAELKHIAEKELENNDLRCIEHE